MDNLGLICPIRKPIGLIFYLIKSFGKIIYLATARTARPIQRPPLSTARDSEKK